jgi:beta-barrel assembly-enhancing protease
MSAWRESQAARWLCPILVAMTLVSGVSAITLVSVEQEIEIGRQTNLQVRKQMTAMQDRQTVDYVNSLGRRLVRFAPGPKYPYTFSVANYREVNAFALPGGPIWIHRGVLHAATNESQVAGVIAHEIAHIAQRHAANQLSNATLTNLGLGLLGAILGNSGGASAAQAAAGLLANGVFLKFSRDDEREADKVGLTMLTRAGWDGRGMVELFEILRKEGQRDPGSVEVFFSSHPSPQDRINELRAEVNRRAKGKRDSPEFQAIRTHVLKLSPPRKMPAQ